MTASVTEPTQTLQIHSLTRRAKSVSPMDVFRSGHADGRFWWSDPVRGVSFAGLGRALALPFPAKRTAPHGQRNLQSALIHDLSPDLPEQLPRFVGGRQFFDAPEVSAGWETIGAGVLLLPEILCYQDPAGTWLTLNARSDSGPVTSGTLDKQLESIQKWIASGATPNTPLPVQISGFHDIETADDWSARVRTALHAIKAGRLDKVVLVRRKQLDFVARPALAALVTAMQSAQPDSFHFAIEAPGGTAFIGATPEMLASLRGRNLHTMALAGTAPRKFTEREDLLQAMRLLEDDKERREHQFVVDGIVAGLSRLADRVDADGQPAIRQLARLQHLETGIRAILQPGVDLFDVVAALHPTPALCGTPPDVAAQLIQALELAGRGWFGGPIGWVDSEGNGDFVVAIRSALITADAAVLYGGAGIVSGSTPEREWDETGMKMDSLGAVFREGGYARA